MYMLTCKFKLLFKIYCVIKCILLKNLHLKQAVWTETLMYGFESKSKTVIFYLIVTLSHPEIEKGFKGLAVR
jgi:hypothetical protein